MGINSPDHKARTVDRAMHNSYNLILTMEQGQKEALKVEFPEVGDRIHLISEMVGESIDIRDPMGKEIDVFRTTARKISSILLQGMGRITTLAKPRKR
jgi:protein-tyrosine-phosphatase